MVDASACNEATHYRTARHKRQKHLLVGVSLSGSSSTCVHEVAKELPASGDLKEGESLLLGHPVQCCTSGHAASHSLHSHRGTRDSGGCGGVH